MKKEKIYLKGNLKYTKTINKDGMKKKQNMIIVVI